MRGAFSALSKTYAPFNRKIYLLCIRFYEVKTLAKWIDEVSERFDIPLNALGKAAKVTIFGSRSVLVENHRGLLDYSDETVLLFCGTMNVRIRGEGLELRAMDKVSIYVTGTIFGVDTE